MNRIKRVLFVACILLAFPVMAIDTPTGAAYDGVAVVDMGAVMPVETADVTRVTPVTGYLITINAMKPKPVGGLAVTEDARVLLATIAAMKPVPVGGLVAVGNYADERMNIWNLAGTGGNVNGC